MKDSKFYQEIVEEGRLEVARMCILEILKERFGSEDAEKFRKVLDAITDSQRLNDLHLLAFRCRRLADFRRSVAAIGAHH